MKREKTLGALALLAVLVLAGPADAGAQEPRPTWNEGWTVVDMKRDWRVVLPK